MLPKVHTYTVTQQYLHAGCRGCCRYTRATVLTQLLLFVEEACSIHLDCKKRMHGWAETTR